MQFSRQQTAEYLADASLEMSRLAQHAGFHDLSRIFEMAILEAKLLTETDKALQIDEAA